MYRIFDFVKDLLQQDSNDREVLARQLDGVDYLLKQLTEKKKELKAKLPVGKYETGFSFITVKQYTRKKVNIGKYFSYMLKHGKMKDFLSSINTSATSMACAGLSSAEINNFQVADKTYTMISIRRKK